MLSSSTLKHNITVNSSIYASIFVSSLYCSIIILLLFFFGISAVTAPLFLLLLVIAGYGARKAYRQKYRLKMSDSGQIEVISSVNDGVISGVVCTSSYYNGLFLSLHLKSSENDFSSLCHIKKFSVVVYRDAVSESEYRLLARLINFGRD